MQKILYLSIDTQIATLLIAIKQLLQGKISPEVKEAITHIHTFSKHHLSYTTPIHTEQDFYRHTQFYVHLVDITVYIGVFIPICKITDTIHLFYTPTIMHTRYINSSTTASL